MSIALGLLTFLLILVSLFLILVVLAQKSKDGGMGAALGGGAAEAAFGAETGNVLSKSTQVAAIIFFIGAFSLYLGRIYERKHSAAAAGDALPAIAVPAAPAPAAPASALPTAPVTAAPVKSAPAAATPVATPPPSQPAKTP